jgi:hypothetical protein
MESPLTTYIKQNKLRVTVMLSVFVFLILVIFAGIKLGLRSEREDVINLLKDVSVGMLSLDENGRDLLSKYDPNGKKRLDLDQDRVHLYLIQINKARKMIVEVESKAYNAERLGSITGKRYMQITNIITEASIITDQYRIAGSLLHGCTLSYNDVSVKQSKDTISKLECGINDFVNSIVLLIEDMEKNK